MNEMRLIYQAATARGRMRTRFLLYLEQAIDGNARLPTSPYGGGIKYLERVRGEGRPQNEFGQILVNVLFGVRVHLPKYKQTNNHLCALHTRAQTFSQCKLVDKLHAHCAALGHVPKTSIKGFVW